MSYIQAEIAVYSPQSRLYIVHFFNDVERTPETWTDTVVISVKEAEQLGSGALTQHEFLNELQLRVVSMFFDDDFCWSEKEPETAVGRTMEIDE